MEKASKNFISNLKKQKRENKSLLFLDNIKIIKDALSNKTILPKCILTSLDEEAFDALEILPNTFRRAAFGNASGQANGQSDGTKAGRMKSVVSEAVHSKNVDPKTEQTCKAQNISFTKQRGEPQSLSQGLSFEEQIRLIEQSDDLPIFRVDEKTIEQLADTKTPQKVLCIAYYTQHLVDIPKHNFLVLDGLQDPGNVGTLIRTAKASGFEDVILVECVRKNNEKLIRSSVGAVLSSNVMEMRRQEFVEFATKNALNLICCDMDGQSIFSFQPQGRVGVVVGSEGQGVSKEIRSLCRHMVKIPMCEGIESLNAGVSGSIIMYEINKNKFN